jgi:dipeptidyl aminopeptidase/acylaminoacyl peptidase
VRGPGGPTRHPGGAIIPGMSDPFDFDRMLALPRLSSLRLSPDGRRLIVAVGRPDAEGKKMTTSLWQVDAADAVAARRLTRSAAGEAGGAAFLPDGSLLFTSGRPDPDAKPDPDANPDPAKAVHALWLLPPDGGEARLLVAPEGGVDGLAVARQAPVVAFGSGLHVGAATFAEDAQRGRARREAGVTALLFEDDYPIRYWDHWLAPRRRHLFAAALPSGPEARLAEPRDLEPGASTVAFEETRAYVTPDGRTVVASRNDTSAIPSVAEDLVAYDVATGQARVLTPGDAWYDAPACSPDGCGVAALRTTRGDPETAQQAGLVVVDLATGAQRTLATDLDRWPNELAWAHDGRAIFFTADDDGHLAVYRVETGGEDDGRVTRLTSGGAYSDLCPSPDGISLYALRSTVASPPRIVRLDARAIDQAPVELVNSIDEGGIVASGVFERLAARAEDGTQIGSWLVRPAGASAEAPAPLVVLVHGGPLGSWNSWHWRWNAHILVARGYAVLEPDPAISLGYGQAMIQRGWVDWGAAPFTDVMAAVEGALRRPDLDASRTALMGGSFGGYMANWVAGHTDRFRAIVTHASLWELRGFHGTTDTGVSMEYEMGDPYRDPARYIRESPREHIGAIRTPMLVIHGEQDFRVPVSEALRLWTDLRRHGVTAKFLYFPDESHWILKPANARLWYATVLAFLDEHMLGKPFERPALA